HDVSVAIDFGPHESVVVYHRRRRGHAHRLALSCAEVGDSEGILVTSHVAGDADSQPVTHARGEPESTRSLGGGGLLVVETDAVRTAVAEDGDRANPLVTAPELRFGVRVLAGCDPAGRHRHCRCHIPEPPVVKVRGVVAGAVIVVEHPYR